MHNLNDYEGAIKDYTIAIKLEPNNILPYINRGNVKFDLNDYEGAINDYTIANKLEPDNEEAKIYIDKCMQKLKNNEE